MANLNPDQLRRLARLGAVARLEQLRMEEAAIRAEFPELFGRGRVAAPAPAKAGGRSAAARQRRPMSAKARKAVSRRMRKFWAERRKAKAAK